MTTKNRLPRRERGKDASSLPKASRSRATLPTPAGQGRPSVDKRAEVPVQSDDPRNMDRIKADLSTSGIVGNASLVGAFNAYSVPEYSLKETIFSLQELIKNSKAGSTAFADEMLIPQATVLNAIFFEMTRRAANNIGNPEIVDRYLRLGLKAQSQSRATLESLSKIKNPSNVAFVKQANIANGPQQVNNGTTSVPMSTRTKNPENTPIELLETSNGEWVERGQTSEAVGSDPHVEAMGTFHWPANGRRQQAS